MTTAQLIQEANRIATVRQEIEEKHNKIFWDTVEREGLNGHPHGSPESERRYELVMAKYANRDAEWAEAGEEILRGYAMHDGIICEATVVARFSRWGANAHYQHRFYTVKSVKKDGTIKRGRFTIKEAQAKLG